MPRPTDTPDIREQGLEDLEALGHPDRLRILRVLATAEEPLSFSTLRKQVDIRDSGRFNYHLTALEGRFVRRSTGGYELGHSGERIVLAAAGLDPAVVTERETSNAGVAESTDEGCPVCGETDCERWIHVHFSSQ